MGNATTNDSTSSGFKTKSSDLEFDVSNIEVSDVARYLIALRASIHVPGISIDCTKVRQAVLVALKEQLADGRAVQPADYAWLSTHQETQLSSLFPTQREVDRDSSLFPSSIGHFVLLGLFGQGGFGTVYHAWDSLKSRFVALKVLKHAGNTEARARMVGEAQLLAKVRCAHVVRVYGAHEFGRETAISMEVIDGDNLAEILQREGPLSRRDAAEMARQIATGIAAAHDSRIVHRDLKPGNVVRGSEGRWFVIDFGLAKNLEQVNSVSTAHDPKGTRAYASLEQITRQDASNPADIFAIGLMLFEATTGIRPFSATDDTVRANQIRNQVGISHRRHQRKLGDSLYAIVRKCLQPFPEHRYGSANELCVDLANFLSGGPVSAQLPRLHSDLYRLVRSHKGAVSLIGIVAFAAIVTGWMFIQHRTEIRIGREMQRVGMVGAALNELASVNASARSNALLELQRVVVEYGPTEDLVQPYVTALVQPGFEVGWTIPASLSQAIDVSNDGEVVAIADVNGGVTFARRDTNANLEHQYTPVASSVTEPVMFLEWSPGDRYLACMHELPLDASNDDRRPFVVRETKSFDSLDWVPAGVQDEGWGFSCQDDSIVVADAATNRIRWIDLASGTQRSSIPILDGRWVRRLALNAHDTWIAIAYAVKHEVEIRDVLSGDLLDRWELPENILDLDVSQSGVVAVASGRDVFLLERGSSQATSVLHAHNSPVDRVRFTRRGDRMLTRSNRQESKLWNLMDGMAVLRYQSTRHAKFVNHDQEISGRIEDNRLTVSTLTQSVYRPTLVIPGSMGGARSLTFSSDESHLYVASNDGLVDWDCGNLSAAPKVIDALPCGDVHRLGEGLFSSHRFQIRCRTESNSVDRTDVGAIPTSNHHYGGLIDVARDGSCLAMFNQAESVIDLFQDGVRSRRFDSANVLSLALSQNGHLLATATRTGTPKLSVHDAESKELVFQQFVEAYDLAFIGEQGRMLVGTPTKYELWDVNANHLIANIPREIVGPNSVFALSDDQSVAAMIVDERVISLFETNHWSKLLEIPTDAYQIRSLALSSNMNRLAAIRGDDTVLLWDLHELRRECELVNLTWPINDSGPNSQVSKSAVVNCFLPTGDVSLMSSAKLVGDAASPVHRRIESLQNQCQREPGNDNVRQSLAYELLSLGGLNESLLLFKQAHAIRPTNERQFNIGVMQIALRQFDEYESDRKLASERSFDSDGIDQFLSRYCLLRPIDDSSYVASVLAAVDRQINRFPDTDWLQVIKAWALVRIGEPHASLELMKSSVDGDWSKLDAFEKAVSVLAAKSCGDDIAFQALLRSYRRHPEHRFELLQLVAQQLVAEATENLVEQPGMN